MAIHREAPKCTFCGRVIAKGKYRDQSNLLTQMQLIGDTFECWEYEKHECKEQKDFTDKMKLETENINDPIKPHLQVGAVSGSLIIELEDWNHTCGDGCCYTYGTDIYLNGEKLDEQNAEDSKNALTAVLEKLGYKVEINYR